MRLRQLATHSAQMAATLVDGLPPLPRPIPLAGRNFRIGIVALDWLSQNGRLPLAPIVDALVETGVEVVGYGLGAASRTSAGLCHDYRNLSGLGPADAAVVMAADRCDILIDATRHIRGGAAWLAASRVARVQVAAWGHGGTTGGTAMDAFVTDGVLTPAGSDDEFSERLLRLPFCLPMAAEARPAGDRLPGPPTAACFAPSYKIGEEVFAGWMGLMKAVPGMRLMLADPGAQAADSLRAAAGSEAERLLFVPRMDRAAHLRRLAAEVDLMLDVPVLGGSASIPDALVAGVPALAAGGSGGPANLAGASMLTACGFESWVADGFEAHLDQAARLLSAPKELAAARDVIHDSRPLDRVNPAEMAKPLVETLRALWTAAN
jgi:predicted O-linked N-acetylglucosamine transferase (SPINDLY family)